MLVPNRDTPRSQWPLGRVVEAEDEEGLVRRARLTVVASELENQGRRKSQLSVLERPIQKVNLLLETEQERMYICLACCFSISRNSWQPNL